MAGGSLVELTVPWPGQQVAGAGVLWYNRFFAHPDVNDRKLGWLLDFVVDFRNYLLRYL